jgi:hypothetical protein
MSTELSKTLFLIKWDFFPVVPNKYDTSIMFDDYRRSNNITLHSGVRNWDDEALAKLYLDIRGWCRSCCIAVRPFYIVPDDHCWVVVVVVGAMCAREWSRE